MLQKLNRICPWLQGPPGLKGEQGDTVVIDYDGRILDALKVSRSMAMSVPAGYWERTEKLPSFAMVTLWRCVCPRPTSPSRDLGLGTELDGRKELIASGS